MNRALRSALVSFSGDTFVRLKPEIGERQQDDKPLLGRAKKLTPQPNASPMSETKKGLAALILAALLAGLNTTAFAKERIDWLRFDYPPMYIVSGPQAGEGYMDNILGLLIDHMPDYDHQISVANLSRIMSEFEQGNNVCVASLFVNEERERLGHISHGTTTQLPSVQLVFRAEDAERFAAFGDPASLRAILADQSLMLGVSERMSYGTVIDATVAEHQQQPNVFLRSGTDVGLGLHEMLIKGRIDYTINYSWAALYTAGPAQAALLDFLPFVEAGPCPAHHVICTKNAWGKRVIAKVDALLADQALTRQRRDFIERWLPESERAVFRKTFEPSCTGNP